MYYNSTRDNSCRVTAAQAISQGISAEGGLFVPENLPKFSLEEIGSMAGPLLGGVIATFVGIKFVFVLAGVIVLIMSVFARRQQKIAMRQYHP